MKDRVEIAIVLRTDELSGKGLKAVATTLNIVISKIEPQLVRIVEAITKSIEEDKVKKGE